MMFGMIKETQIGKDILGTPNIIQIVSVLGQSG